MTKAEWLLEKEKALLEAQALHKLRAEELHNARARAKFANRALVEAEREYQRAVIDCVNPVWNPAWERPKPWIRVGKGAAA